MTERRRGRPPREQSVGAETILSAALEILDTAGADALTMRALAVRLGVNPMTPYHYFTDQDGLIKTLAERVYAEVAAPTDCDAKTQLRGLLLSYHAQVERHPGLTMAIFSRPQVFPDQARRITQEVENLLLELGLSGTRSQLWLNILVDFTHGAALATAMQQAGGNDYAASLDELLDQLKA